MVPSPKTLLISIPQRNREADTGGSIKVRPVASENMQTTPKAAYNSGSIQEPGTTARRREHLSVGCHQVLQVIFCVSVYRTLRKKQGRRSL